MHEINGGVSWDSKWLELEEKMDAREAERAKRAKEVSIETSKARFKFAKSRPWKTSQEPSSAKSFDETRRSYVKRVFKGNK